MYQDRFIFVHYDYEGPASNPYTTTWEFMVYDTNVDVWSGLPNQVSHNSSDGHYDTIKYGLWFGDHFIYFLSVTNMVRDIATLAVPVKHATTPIYYISYFVENWHIIRPFVLMRKLIANVSAEAKQNQECISMKWFCIIYCPF